MKKNVALAQQDRKHFAAFVKHFEAVVAYVIYLKTKETRWASCRDHDTRRHATNMLRFP